MMKWIGLLSAAFAAAISTSAIAVAQQYPSQDIRFVSAFPPGTGADIVVRFFAEKLRPLTGKNVIVENRAGAGGNIAMEYIGRAAPNGLTIFVHSGSAIAANMHLFKKPPFDDVGKSLQVAATLSTGSSFMMVVDPKRYPDIKTVADVTKTMKAKGDKATYASIASTGTVMGELYKAATGITATEVAYKSATDVVNDMASGAVDYAMLDPVFSLAQQREGRLRILGVSTAHRVKAIPDLPTMSEQGVPMDLNGWYAAFVPAGTPQPIIEQINRWFAEAVSSPDSAKFLAGFGADDLIEKPDVAQKRLLDDVVKWGEYIKIAKIQPQG